MMARFITILLIQRVLIKDNLVALLVGIQKLPFNIGYGVVAMTADVRNTLACRETSESFFVMFEKFFAIFVIMQVGNSMTESTYHQLKYSAQSRN